MAKAGQALLDIEEDVATVLERYTEGREHRASRHSAASAEQIRALLYKLSGD